ncbi:MAG TPA: AMIN domain-containing protein, partial [Candidatus Caenarcaniphilales bacterium]
MRQSQSISCFWLAAAGAVLMVQPVRAAVVPVTAVELEPTTNGLEIILETTGGASTLVQTSGSQQRFVADITNAQLRLPQGNSFCQNNPVVGITSLCVSALSANSIRVVVTASTGVLTGQVLLRRGGALVVSLTPTPAPATAAPQISPSSRAPAFKAEGNPEVPATVAGEAPAELADGEGVEPLELVVTAERLAELVPHQSAPVYTITAPEIQKQGGNSVAEVLRGLPGFAINDVGFGADIHTGTYYRGQSINQSVLLLNGRPINTNI